MDIKEIRRQKLREWTAVNGTPAAEKSYFSQLFSGAAAFGEKTARRLEKKYKMGDGFLDDASPNSADSVGNELEEAIRLLALYRASTAVGRAFILQAAEAAEKGTGQLS